MNNYDHYFCYFVIIVIIIIFMINTSNTIIDTELIMRMMIICNNDKQKCDIIVYFNLLSP